MGQLVGRLFQVFEPHVFLARVRGATLHGGLVVMYVEKHFGQDHFEVSRALTNLGLVYGRLGDKSKANVDRTPTHNAHLCSTVCSQARNASHALGSSNHGLHFIFVRMKRICHLVLHMSHPLLFSHLPFTTSTSSSSFTLLSTTTQEHEEHPVHHTHLQALPVDKLRHQESLWREDLQSGGNPHDISHRL